MNKKILPLITLGFLFAGSASATLIASESFRTVATGDTGSTYQQDGNDNFSFAFNRSTTGATNTGFSTGNEWINNSSTSSPSLTGLTHNGTVGSTQVGGASYSSVTTSRNVYRQLASTPPTSSTYYLSALVSYTSLSGSQIFAMGMSDYTGNNTGNPGLNTGFYVGLANDVVDGTFLAAYAGGNTYNLGDATAGTTYQIVLQLDVDGSGIETLNAWYAADGAGSLTQGLTNQSVETWIDASDLSIFSMQTSNRSPAGSALFDEMRFGTELSDVTAIPEPSSILMVAGALAAMLMFRRRRR